MSGSLLHDLSGRVRRGTWWATGGMVGSRALAVLSDIILVRLLAPEDFGVFAIALSVVALTEGTTQTGFESALIQRQDRPERFLDTAWTLEIVRSLLLFGAAFIAAPWVAVFFDTPDAASVLRVVAVSFLLQGSRNIGVVFFKKRLEFHKQSVLEIVPMVVYAVVAIGLAVTLRSVWALAGAVVARRAATCVTSYVMHPYRPRLRMNVSEAAELFNFGKWILGSSILVVIRNQGTPLFVGHQFGAAALGFFNRAETFSTLLFAQLSELAWKVGYSTFSLLQSDRDRLWNAYGNTLGLLGFVGLPAAGGLYVLAHDFVEVVLTARWIQLVPLIQIFCIQSSMNIINTPSAILFQAVGRPAIGTRISGGTVGLLFILLYPFSVRWGLIGAAAALTISLIVMSPLRWWMAIRILDIRVIDFVGIVTPVLVNAALMMFAMEMARRAVSMAGGATRLIVVFAVGVVVYGTASFVLHRRWKNRGLLVAMAQLPVPRRANGETSPSKR